MRQRDVVLYIHPSFGIFYKRIPQTIAISLIWLHDGFIKGKPVADLFAKFPKCRPCIVYIGFYHFPALPAASLKQIGRHIKVIQIHQQLNLLFFGAGTDPMIKRSAFLIKLSILIEQSAPLDRGPKRIQPKAFQQLDILFVFLVKIVSHIAAHFVVKI